VTKTVDDTMSITLEYLKGKRRAEQALGFLTEAGQLLMACTTPREIADAIARHLLRLDLDFCLIDYKPISGTRFEVTAGAPGLGDLARDITDLCRFETEYLSWVSSPEDSATSHGRSTSKTVGESRVMLHHLALQHALAGTVTLSVARVRTDSKAFSSAELIILTDIACRFITSVSHLHD
jgi:hypothetical protein